MNLKHKTNRRPTRSNLDLREGVVYKKVSGSYTVYSSGRQLTCSLGSPLRGTTDPVAVGDRVQFHETQPGEGAIMAVLPRENRLARRGAVPMPGAHAHEQVIVANVGQVVPVFAAANPPPRWNMLDRYLVTAESLDLPSLICITKLDLALEDSQLEDDLRSAVEAYRRAGYRVLLVSAFTGEGVAEMKAALDGKISVFLGKSGVGKTSLLNAIQPGLGARVSAVSSGTLGKGRHTTTHMEMFPLESGGAVVDTPGVREFGLWDVDQDDLALFFPEMRPYIGQCKFGLDCRHDEEPGCAVRKAVMNGQVSPRRYQSYIKLREET